MNGSASASRKREQDVSLSVVACGAGANSCRAQGLRAAGAVRTTDALRAPFAPSRIELPVGAMMGPVVGAEGVPPALKNGFKTAAKALFLLLLKPPRTMKAPQNFPQGRADHGAALAARTLAAPEAHPAR